MSPETVAVLPTVDVKAQAPVSPADADQTLSSSTASLSFYAASLNMKDRRAYERERQRAKKTAEYVVSRAQKEQNPTPPGTLSAPLRALWARTVSGRHREHVQVPQSQPRDSSGCSPGADSVPRKDLSSLFPSGDDVDSPRTRSSKSGSGRTSSMRSDSPKPEVALVDLINTTPRSPRKPRKGKGVYSAAPLRSFVMNSSFDTVCLFCSWGFRTCSARPLRHSFG